MRNAKYGSALLAIMAITAPAVAQDSFSLAAGRWDDPDNGNFVKLRARLYADAATVDWNGTELDETEFRAARLGIEGRWFDWSYKAEFDFADGGISAKDVVATWSGDDFTLNFGHQKTTNSLEEQTSSRYITFMERGTNTDLFALGRRVGLVYRTGSDRYSFSAGVFGGRTGDLSESLEIDDSAAASARLSLSPVGEDTLTVHLGGSVRIVDYGNLGTRVRTRPGIHTTGRIVTADFRPGTTLGQADSSALYGLEAAVISGRFHLHAEVMHLDVEGPIGDPGFDSGFVNLGWFVTGETRSYRASSGAFRRTSPLSPVSEGGAGAFEMALRYEFSDLDDVAGGQLNSWTLGLNWYVESHLRLMANVIEADLSVPGAPDIDVSGVQFRAQWDF